MAGRFPRASSVPRDSPSQAIAPVARSGRFAPLSLTDWPSEAHAPAARDAGFASLSLTDCPSEANAPAARFVGFAPLSLTSALAGDPGEAQIPPLRASRFGRDDSLLLRSRKSGAELGSLVEEACVGGGVDGQAGAEADEAGDELGAATDEAELTAELLFPVSRCTPLPPPVREAGV